MRHPGFPAIVVFFGAALLRAATDYKVIARYPIPGVTTDAGAARPILR
jgi:hypothetical protein